MNHILHISLITLVACFNEGVFAQGQELIINGGFEKHEQIRTLDLNSPTWFGSHSEYWSDLSSGARICDCEYEFTETEKQQRVYARHCLPEIFQKSTNCSVVELGFSSHVTDDVTKTYAAGVDASYISQRLSQPLAYGEVYKLQFQVYIPEQYNQDAVQMSGHLGARFSNNLYPMEIQSQMLTGSQVNFKVSQYDQWIKLECHFKPLCNINYITLGVFHDDNWPDYYSERGVIYFIDNISVVKANESYTDSVATFNCYQEEATFASAGGNKAVTVHFDRDSDIPVDIDSAALVELIQLAQADKKTIQITGHTDNTGSDNYNLASRRVNAVSNYFQQQLVVDSIYLERHVKADSLPVASNTTSDGRKLNRRVEVVVGDDYLSQHVYREILRDCNTNPDEAMRKAFKWLYITPQQDHILILLDRRLANLRKHVRWDELDLRVRASYSNKNQPALAFMLDSLAAEDQRYRTLEYAFRRITNTIEGDLNETQFQIPDDTKGKMVSHDKRNLSIVLELLNAYEWPKISDVGLRPARAPYYAINHSQDIELIEKYLPLLQHSCETGEAEWINYANMYDRLMQLKDLPQKYGTHYLIDGKTVTYYKFDNLEEVNRNRTRIGLKELNKEIGFKIK